MNRRQSLRRVLGTALVVALAATACGGGDDDGTSSDDGATGAEGEPVAGGEVVYGLEAETTGGWCLPEAQLAISGIMVARAIYDTLTIANEDGGYEPFLAESVEPNDDYTEWTITLRDGITFHDGTPLDATVVKNNLDAYRGEYPARSPLLFVFILEDIEAVDVVDDMTVKVTTSVPWPALPATLFSNGRMGMLAQAQLDDPDSCDANLIGTGPFVLEDWAVNDSLSATRNPDYWLADAIGEPVPYLDRVVFRPVTEEATRTNSLLGGELTAMITNDSPQMAVLNQEAEAGNVGVTANDDFPEVSYTMFNVTKPPFDNPTARRAVATAMDRDEIRTLLYQDQVTMASGPFGPGVTGYLDDAGMPAYDPAEAEQLVAQYEQEAGSPLEFTLTVLDSEATLQLAQLIQEQFAEVGIDMGIRPVEQSAQINTALGNDWQAQQWRNHPGGDPDTQYNWWYSGSPVNFGKFSDPQMDELLDQGRSEVDEEVRRGIYEDVNRLFGEQVYNVWLNWSRWTVGTQPDVNGIYGPDTPEGSAPFTGLASGHSLAGTWIAG